MLMLLALVAVAMVAQTPAGGGNHSNQPTNAGAAIQPGNQNQAATAGPQDSSKKSGPSPNSTSIELVSAGTEMHTTLDTPLSTKTSKPGDRFTATVSDPVGSNSGAVVIPGGSRVEGEVAEEDEGKTLAAFRGKGKLSLRFRDVVLPNGQALPLTATLISVHDTSGKNTKKTDEEGQFQSSPRSNRDVVKSIGVGGGIGTGAGLVFGSPLKGLAIGALAGGGYVLATQGKDVNLPAQAGMVIRLDQTVSSTGASTSQR
jgi:hypothetical protein